MIMAHHPRIKPFDGVGLSVCVFLCVRLFLLQIFAAISIIGKYKTLSIMVRWYLTTRTCRSGMVGGLACFPLHFSTLASESPGTSVSPTYNVGAKSYHKQHVRRPSLHGGVPNAAAAGTRRVKAKAAAQSSCLTGTLNL
jgi:hypothetical protein